MKNDPGLAKESAHSLTLGGEWSRASGGLRRNAGCNLFDTRVADSFILEEDPSQSTADESALVRRNGGGSHIYGAEFNVGITRGRGLALQFGYVEQRSRYDTAIAPLEGTSSRRIQRSPDCYGTATLDAARPLAGLRLFVGAKLTGSMEVLTMRVGVKTLTDDRQKDLDQGEFRDSGYLYGPCFPRSFYVSTEWTF